MKRFQSPFFQTISLFFLVVTVVTTVFIGCTPSKTQSRGASGREIVQVNPVPREAFETVFVDGVEMRQSRSKKMKPARQPGGSLHIAGIGDGPKTFNVWASYDATSSEMGEMLTASLVENDAYSGEVIPYLAKAFKILDDNRTYIVTLRKGLTWSDGQPITSKDIIFTYNTLVKEGYGNPSSRDNLLVEGQFPQVRAIDDLTIEFKTHKPFAPMLRKLSTPIAPAHVFEPIIQNAKNREEAHKAFSSTWGTDIASQSPETFVSGGMWLLESYDPSEQRVTFKPNPHYFMVDQGGTKLPYLEKYIVSFVKDMNNMQLQFEQGKIDMYSVPAQYVSHVRKLDLKNKNWDFNLCNLGPSDGTTFMAFNMNSRIDPESRKPFVDPVKSAWFNNLNFRKAVDFAVSRNDMVQNILKGVGKPLYTAEGLTSIYLNQAIAKGHEQDLEKAKQLLSKAGFTWNETGQLLDSKGNHVEFNLLTNTGNDQREDTGASIKQDLEKLGMTLNYKPLEFNLLVSKLNHGNWETMIMGLTASPLEPHNGANVWKSGSALHLFNQRDVKGGKKADLSDRLPWEKELDDIFEQASLILDKSSRAKYYNRYQEIVYEQAPMIYLYSQLKIYAINNHIKNLDPTPLGNVRHNLEELWVEEASSGGHAG